MRMAQQVHLLFDAVGGGKRSQVVFDSGSVGMHILAQYAGKGITRTTTTFAVNDIADWKKLRPVDAGAGFNGMVLEALRQACRDGSNTMPFILDCARAYCTLYEIRAAIESVFGAYREPVFF